MLSSDPDLAPLNLQGGLNIWAFRETQQVFQWALSARNDYNTQDYTSLHTHVVSMLDYLDGSGEVHRDLPAGTPILADPKIARVGLLEFDPTQQNPPGYL